MYFTISPTQFTQYAFGIKSNCNLCLITKTVLSFVRLFCICDENIELLKQCFGVVSGPLVFDRLQKLRKVADKM